MKDWTDPFEVGRTSDASIQGRWWPGRALAQRSTGVALIAALLAPAAAAPVAAARGKGIDPVINLPASPGGDTGGDDDVEGGPAAEDQPDPSTPDPVPAAPEPAAPAPEPAAPQ